MESTRWTNINFLLDKWYNNGRLADLMGVPDNHVIDTSLKVAHFISPSKEWDTIKLQGMVPCLQVILATPISFNPIPDTICWDLREVEIFPQNQQHGLPMDWIFEHLRYGNSTGYES